MNTVDAQEIQNFSKDSAQWWDVKGPFQPLHKLNPTRLSYIREQICHHYGYDNALLKPYQKLDILDVGCGGGLLCEPMARLGANVTGIDADENAIHVAQEHAKNSALDITYKNTSSDKLSSENKKFDVVLAMEIIEHVSNTDDFIKSIVDLCKPNGVIILSTLSRTAKSFAVGIIAAEYILRWVSQGTHSWKKFIKPAELHNLLCKHGATPHNVSGSTFNPLKNEFSIAPHDTDVNYFMSATKPPI